MKAGSRLLNFMLLGWCASVGCAGLVRAQTWSPEAGRAGGINDVVTTGGVTYVEYTYVVQAVCERLHSIGPLIRNGTNFSFDFAYEKASGISCPNVFLEFSTNVILGVLAPGTYNLTTTSWSVPVSTKTFTVRPVLQPIGYDTNGFFQIQMSSGITNVSYVLQCSTNLVDWTSLSTNSVSTNSVGVALVDNAPVLSGVSYYRVLCQ
jgi:hypothetical protein